MKFSIIICAYNGEETLFRCLDAIKEINHPKANYEVIAIDNASTDRTFRILTNYDIRVVGCRKYAKTSEVMKVGAKNAVFPNLLFINQRTVVKKDILNGNHLMKKDQDRRIDKRCQRLKDGKNLMKIYG